MTHPHHPLYGQRVEIIRVRRAADPDLIIQMPDGYHGAIAASWTDYARSANAESVLDPPALLTIEGLWQMAQFVERCRTRSHLPKPDQV